MRLLLPIFLLFFHSLGAQNLLVNPGFEDENICSEFRKNCSPEGWIASSFKSYFYFDDAKHAFDGQHFLGIAFHSEKKYERQYFVRSRLLCALRKGSVYRLSFRVLTYQESMDSLGIYISSSDMLYRKNRITTREPQFWMADASINAGSEWQEVRFDYTAKGDEQFINIGDFSVSDPSYFQRPGPNHDFYAFIDHLELAPLNPSEKLCPGEALVRETEYAIDARHGQLEKMIYQYMKRPAVTEPLSKTVIQRVDTLVIPDVLFATNSYTLTPAALKLLDSFLLKSEVLAIDSVVVEGHTDSTGTAAGNRRLSENRAHSVADRLGPHFQAQMITRGWASEKPVADNRTAAGRQRNRRVEIYLYIRE
jgi:outer membrane protein OmpA-like peptidoglycan-associated protein